MQFIHSTKKPTSHSHITTHCPQDRVTQTVKLLDRKKTKYRNITATQQNVTSLRPQRMSGGGDRSDINSIHVSSSIMISSMFRSHFETVILSQYHGS